MLQLSFQQRILCFAFFSSNLVGTAIGFYGLAKVLEHHGASSSLLAFGAAGLVALLTNFSTYLIGSVVGRGVRFVILHMLLAGAALLGIQNPSPEYLGPIAFIATFGLGSIIHTANRLLAQRLVSPFEAERLFPLLGNFRLAGIVLGAAIIFKLSSSPLGLELYYGWLLLEIVLSVLGLILIRSNQAVAAPQKKAPEVSALTAIIESLARYPSLRLLIIWTMGWGFCTTFIISQSAEIFALQMPGSVLWLLAALGIASPILITLSNQYLYHELVDRNRLGSMQFNTIIVLSVAGILLGFHQAAWLGVIAWLITQVADKSLDQKSFEAQTSLYPLKYREGIVFILQQACFGLGAALVAALSFLETIHRFGIFLCFVLALMSLAKRYNSRFARGVVRLLSSNDPEERRNAIALYDRLEAQDEYEEFIYYLNEGSDHENSIAILKTFASLKTVQPMPDILNLLARENLDNSMRIAILSYIDVLDFSVFDPFLHYRTVETLKKICLESQSNVARAMAIRIFVQNAPAEESVSFVLEELESTDNRVVANAIEGLSHLNYPGVVKLLSPYLKHSVARIRANAIVALWKYPKARFRVKAAITSMLFSDEMSHRISGTHATGKVRDDSYQSQLVGQLSDAPSALRRVTLIALVELGETQYLDDVVELILGDDEPHARNTCYLAMSLEAHLLNEGLIARLYQRGPEARELATERFTTCGRLCRRQLDLLAGRTDRLTRRSLV